MTPATSSFAEADFFELRLFIEELVCNSCRFKHAAEQNIDPLRVRIRQEFYFGVTDAFADILIECPGQAGYFVEVDYGYAPARVLESIKRKYASVQSCFKQISKLILVVEQQQGDEWADCFKEIKKLIPKAWELEIWDEVRLLSFAEQYFNIKIDGIRADNIIELHTAIKHARGHYAFGDDYHNEPLDDALLWHFGHWRLRELFHTYNQSKRSILQPTEYEDVVVIFADLSGFSSYVRDTPHKRTIRDCLSAFCAKSRYQIISDGGMLYQFLGDAVIGLFGIPDRSGNYVDHAFDCARSLLMLGDAVSNEWQRQLDRLQAVSGSHIGMAMGSLQILPLHPYSRTHTGAIGDAINMAARLSSYAQPGQIVTSNIVYRSLSPESQKLLQKTAPIEAKNVGRIKAWTFSQDADASSLSGK